MKTLISWLIANVEVISTIILLIIFEVYIFTAEITSISADDMGTLAFGGALGIVLTKSLIGGVPSKNTIGDVVNLFVTAVAYILIWVITADEGQYHAFFTPSISVLVISIILAVVVAVFTARSFYEVVSRRMLYVNSNVSMFEIAGTYTFNRFVATFSSASTFGLILALVYLTIK